MELDVVQPSSQATEVGAYFVSNYPPFSAWSAAQLPAAFSILQELPSGPKAVQPPPLGLYLHIPFCRKRCKFCYFRVYTDKNAHDVETYLAHLAHEVELYKQTARLRERPLDYVYFGGGTPSFLSSEQLKRLVERIHAAWGWDTAREVTFECEPGTLQKHKVDTIRGLGVTRLSLGVEHFDDGILETNGRAHRSKEVYRSWEWIRDAGFAQVNIDLISGMVGETDALWDMAVDRALQLQPDSLTIYQMELPPNAVLAREQRETGRQVVATWAQKRAWVERAFARFEASGYVVSSGYTLVKPGPHSNFVYRDALWRGADMVGTGVASFSHVGGVHFQNLDRWEDYLAALAEGRLPLARALRLTPRQALIRELVLQLKLGRILPLYFESKFGVRVQESFAAPLQSLYDQGLAQLLEGAIHLTRAGLLRVDELLPRFFDPEFRRETAA